MSQDVEAVIARHTVRRAIVVGPVLVGVFGLLRGADGAVAATIGVLVVVGAGVSTRVGMAPRSRYLTLPRAATRTPTPTRIRRRPLRLGRRSETLNL